MVFGMVKKKGFRLQRALRAAIDAFRGMMKTEAPGTAAAMSYFSLLALFPAILILAALVDAFLGTIGPPATLRHTILALFPGSNAFVSANLEELTNPSPPVVLSCLLIVAWSSTWVFIFVENAFNRAWGVPKRRSFWQSRLRSCVLLTLAGTLLLTSMGVKTVVSALRSAAYAKVPEFAQDQIIGWLWSSLLVGAGFPLAVLVFLVIYKLLPDRELNWLEALSGAIVSAVLWELGSYIFAKLVPLFDYQRIYGRMGAIVALMAWVYVASLIVLFGAHFSAQLHKPEEEQQEVFPHLEKTPTIDASTRKKLTLYSHQSQQR